MTFNVGDLVTVKLRATYLGEEIQNILTYNIVTYGISADIDDILDFIQTNLLGELEALVSSGMVWDLIRIDNLTDAVTFAEKTVNVVGDLAEDPMPSYVAGGFTKRVGTKLTRPGSFRLAGMTEGAVSGNTWAPVVADRIAVELALTGDLEVGVLPSSQITMSPVVARRTSTVPPHTFLVNPVTSVVFKSVITTQNSRKG